MERKAEFLTHTEVHVVITASQDAASTARVCPCWAWSVRGSRQSLVLDSNILCLSRLKSLVSGVSWGTSISPECPQYPDSPLLGIPAPQPLALRVIRASRALPLGPLSGPASARIAGSSSSPLPATPSGHLHAGCSLAHFSFSAFSPDAAACLALRSHPVSSHPSAT